MKKIGFLAVSLVVSLTACGGSDKPERPVIDPVEPVAVTGVEISAEEEFTVGTMQKLIANVLPANAKDKSVWWSSDAPQTVSVDGEGNIMVRGVGTADISVGTYDGDFRATCVVTGVDPDAGKEYELVWAEEFDYEGLPSDENWIIQQQQPGWVNNELQTYVRSEENLSVKDGMLTINLIKEEDGRVTSGRVESAGKKSFTYGRFEIRAKLPKGLGTWPAIWMLGENINHGTGWPTCGEIDIMEHVGYDQNVIVASAHTRDRNHNIGTQASGRTTIPGVSDDFHVYSVEWTRTSMSWAVDGKVFYTYIPQSYTLGDWPFTAPQFVILNIAWGGMWGGAEGVDESVLPQKMEVDYVRVYQKK